MQIQRQQFITHWARPLLITIAIVIWLSASLGGFKLLFDYSQTPGVITSMPTQWPVQSKIPVNANQATLLMFVHPHCPCSQASVGELATLMARSPQQLNAYVLFLQPKDYPASWAKSELWSNASAIPGVKPLLDPEGKEARLFHSTTSGQVAIYTPSGHLTFSGGITPSRGHFGDSLGLDSALASLDSFPDRACDSAVFGCPLFGPTLGSEKQ